jgi:hypothetical protein
VTKAHSSRKHGSALFVGIGMKVLHESKPRQQPIPRASLSSFPADFQPLNSSRGSRQTLISAAGLIFLREVGERLGIFERLASHLDDRRADSRSEYSLIKPLPTRLVALSAEYTQGGRGAAQPRRDVQAGCGGDRCDAPARAGKTTSQPTPSRLIATVGDLENVNALWESLAALAARSIRASGTLPAAVVLDVDSLPIEGTCSP